MTAYFYTNQSIDNEGPKMTNSLSTDDNLEVHGEIEWWQSKKTPTLLLQQIKK